MNEKIYFRFTVISIFSLLIFILSYSHSFGQCDNVNFENGNFNGWTGSTSKGPSNIDPAFPDPFRYKGLVIGKEKQSSSDSIEASHYIMKSGVDGIVGAALPVNYPGSTYSARLGNPLVVGGGEVLSYKMNVTKANSAFTYNYAVVLDNSSDHDEFQLPFFKIRLWEYSADGKDSMLVNCATYDVNPLTAPIIGGFVEKGLQGTIGAVLYKPWSSATIPLQNQEGKTVKIEFITRDCSPMASATGPKGSGGHFAYAYIDGNCGSLPTATSTRVCQGQNSILTAPSGALTYKWTGPNSDTSTAGVVSGLTSQVAAVNLPGTYTATMTTTVGGDCSFKVNIDADFGLPAPTSNFTATNVCTGAGSVITYTGNAGSGATFNWDFGGGTVLSGSGKGPYSVTWPTEGTKTVILTVSQAGCSTQTSVNLTVHSIPVAHFGPFAEGCTPVCVNFVDSSSVSTGRIQSWLWNFGDAGSAGNTSTDQNPSHCYKKEGEYDVTLKVQTDNGCTATSLIKKMVKVYPYPAADFTMNPRETDVTSNKIINFFDKSSGTPSTYNWTFGDGATSNLANPKHLYADEGTFPVCLQVINQNGCGNIFCDKVQIRPIWTFYIPNAFTPPDGESNMGHIVNSLGVNDGFIGTGVNIIEHQMWIFDRWGENIYTTEKTSLESSVPWNGRVDNSRERVQEDVYVYRVVFKDIFNKLHKRTGTVTVIN